MPGVVLAVIEHSDAAVRVLAAAQCLAARAGAVRINVLAVRRPPIDTIMPTEEILTPHAEIRIRDEERRRAAALKAVFDVWAATAQPSSLATEWFDVEGRVEQVVGGWGRRADFVVLTRPSQRHAEPEQQAIHAALFDTDRPVLVVPPEWPPSSFGRRVAIAWRDDGRTSKTVLAALRWLGHAEHIDVLAGARPGAMAPRLPKIIEEHGIKAELHVLPIAEQGLFGEVLLAKAHALGCDMLVVGAFVQDPVRRLILGGVTRYMLTHADLPVFMRH